MNLRPSGYEPDELPGCSTPRHLFCATALGCLGAWCALQLWWCASFQRGPYLSRSGGDLLSHVLRRSTISAAGLNCRVRDGIGCLPRAIATRPRKIRLSPFERGFIGALSSVCPGRFTDRWCVWLPDRLFDAALSGGVLLLADRIKPVGRLVPVN